VGCPELCCSICPVAPWRRRIRVALVKADGRPYTVGPSSCRGESLRAVVALRSRSGGDSYPDAPGAVSQLADMPTGTGPAHLQKTFPLGPSPLSPFKPLPCGSLSNALGRGAGSRLLGGDADSPAGSRAFLRPTIWYLARLGCIGWCHRGGTRLPVVLTARAVALVASPSSSR